MNEGRHAVVVMDESDRLIEGHYQVPSNELPMLVKRLQEQHPRAALLLDGEPLGAPQPQVLVDILRSQDPSDAMAFSGSTPIQASVRLAHTMLWSTFDRAARTQAWMLQQANVFTRDLLENNRKLADQTSDTQQHFQQAMQRLNLMDTEQKLIEQDLMARRLSRHAIAQNRAEEEASRPPAPPDHGWIEELLSGVSALLGGPGRSPKPGQDN